MNPYENVDEEIVTEEYILDHISVYTDGFYRGSWPDVAAGFGYTLSNPEIYEIGIAAEYGTKQMVFVNCIGRVLNKWEQACFDHYFNIGFQKGQMKVAEQLYELAQMGEFKAIDKFLEVRGAFGQEQADTGPKVHITLATDDVPLEGEGPRMPLSYF